MVTPFTATVLADGADETVNLKGLKLRRSV
jgi:hypothetical protein